MNDEVWVFERKTGAYSPAETDGKGNITGVVVGFAFITSQDEIVRRGAKVIVAVDDVYTGENPKVVWRDGVPISDNQDDMNQDYEQR